LVDLALCHSIKPASLPAHRVFATLSCRDDDDDSESEEDEDEGGDGAEKPEGEEEKKAEGQVTETKEVSQHHHPHQHYHHHHHHHQHHHVTNLPSSQGEEKKEGEEAAEAVKPLAMDGLCVFGAPKGASMAGGEIRSGSQ
jgi:hypothetical protein